MQDQNESNYQVFLKWFKREGGLSKKIKYPEYFESIEVCGVIAQQNIEGNEVFLAIPKKLIIGIEKVEKSELGQILLKYSCFKNNQQNQGQFNVLTLFIIWENMKGKASFYFPYLQTIQKSQTIVSWSDQDIKKMQDPNITLDFVNELRKQFYQVFQQFKQIVKYYPKLFKQQLTWQLFMESYSLVMTRCFGWGLPQLMLVPYVDFLNHHCHGIHHYVFNTKFQSDKNVVDLNYIIKRKQLDLSLLGINNTNQIPKSYIRNKREQFIFKHKDTLEHCIKDTHHKQYKYDERLHNNETKQCLSMIQQQLLQQNYNIQLLASSNSQDNDSQQQQDDVNITKFRIKLNKIIQTQIQESFQQPKPEVNKEFQDNVLFNWWYQTQDNQNYFIVAANRFIQKGQQIYNNYGRRSNKFLLIYYGFTHLNNKYDSVSFRFWSQQIYNKTGKFIFAKYLTQKDWIDKICLGNQRYNFQSVSDQFRLKLDNICYELMAFLRLRIISKKDPYKTMFAKKEITCYKIHSLQLEILMLEDYMTVLKEIIQIYQPEKCREQLSNKERNFFANILIQSNKNIIENHVKGVNILKKVVNKLKEGSLSLIEVYKSSLTTEEQNCDVNELKTIKCNNRKFILDYIKMLDRYFQKMVVK